MLQFLTTIYLLYLVAHRESAPSGGVFKELELLPLAHCTVDRLSMCPSPFVDWPVEWRYTHTNMIIYLTSTDPVTTPSSIVIGHGHLVSQTLIVFGLDPHLHLLMQTKDSFECQQMLTKTIVIKHHHQHEAF